MHVRLASRGETTRMTITIQTDASSYTHKKARCAVLLINENSRNGNRNCNSNGNNGNS